MTVDCWGTDKTYGLKEDVVGDLGNILRCQLEGGAKARERMRMLVIHEEMRSPHSVESAFDLREGGNRTVELSTLGWNRRGL